MYLQNQTHTDFESVALAVKEEYLKVREETGNSFVTQEEYYANNSMLIVTNVAKATKIIFNKEMGIITKSEIYIGDVKMITNMLKKLK